jgi:hypothetical protein
MLKVAIFTKVSLSAYIPMSSVFGAAGIGGLTDLFFIVIIFFLR